MRYFDFKEPDEIDHQYFVESCRKQGFFDQGFAWVALEYPKGKPLNVCLTEEGICLAANILMFNCPSASISYHGYKQLENTEWFLKLKEYHKENRFKLLGGKSIILHGVLVSDDIYDRTIYTTNEVDFIVLDIRQTDGTYSSYGDCANFCDEFGIKVSPELSIGKFERVLNGLDSFRESKILYGYEGIVTKDNPIYAYYLKPVKELKNTVFNRRVSLLKIKDKQYPSLDLKETKISFNELKELFLSRINRERVESVVSSCEDKKPKKDYLIGKVFSDILRQIEYQQNVDIRKTFTQKEWNDLQRSSMKKASETIQEWRAF